MKKDIELTRIQSTYEELWDEIVELLDKCIKKNGEIYSANVMRKLAIEMGARNIFASVVVVQDEGPQELMESFVRSMFVRYEQLVEDAVRLGILERGEK